MFKIDVLLPIIKFSEDLSHTKYKSDENTTRTMRILADHMRSAALIAADGVLPSNKDQGYFLRRLLRKMIRYGKNLGIENNISTSLLPSIVGIFKSVYPQIEKKQTAVQNIFKLEESKFRVTLENARLSVEKAIKKSSNNWAQTAFDLFQSTGYHPELFLEDLKEKNIEIDKRKFNQTYKLIFEKHQNISKKGVDKKFKGGLADTKGQTIKYHTATHLLHQSLFAVLGNDVRQEGSNITTERLRFDFSSSRKPEKKDLEKATKIINQKIKEKLPVEFKIIPKKEALKIGARSFFKEKYPDMVKVYFVGKYSKEFCGGPHVKNTKEIGKLEIFKFEKIGSNLYRIYAR